MNTKPLHMWMYSMWYPALLGTFGVNMLSAARSESPAIDLPAWEWVVILYLTVQHGEGASRTTHNRSGYARSEFFFDTIEAVLMILIFISFGRFLEKYAFFATWRNPDTIRLLLFLMFITPVAKRACAKVRGRLQPGHCGFYWSLTWLSIGAGIASLMVESLPSMLFVYLLLFIYIGAFILWNDYASRRHVCFKRPTSD